MTSSAAGAAPRLLFLPRCGPHGIGEYVRCLTLAQAFAARRPEAQISFATRERLARLPGDEFERIPLPREAAQGERFDAILGRLQPHLLIANNRGRQRELENARARGAGVVAIFSTGRRSRARRLDVLRSIDQLWIVPGEGRRGARAPSRLARWLSGNPHCEIVETLHPLPDPARAAALRRTLGLEPAYALFAAGGGGWQLDGRPAPDVFADAAARAAQRGMQSVWVAGPLHAGAPEPAPGVRVLREQGPAAMVDLIAGAEVVASSGGGGLGWVLSLGRPCVTTPMPTGDQRQRTEACGAQGTALVVEGSAQALADGVLALVQDAARRSALVARVAERAPRNALPRCLDLLEDLLRARGALA